MALVIHFSRGFIAAVVITVLWLASLPYLFGIGGMDLPFRALGMIWFIIGFICFFIAAIGIVNLLLNAFRKG